MKKETFIVDKFHLPLEKPTNATYISYSQYSNYQKCPRSWKLKYIDKIKESVPSIHAIFGTSMHNVIQNWLQVMFMETVKKSEELNFDSMLLQEIKNNYAKDVEKYQRHFSTKEELTEFYLDGLETLKYLRKKRKVYFDRQHQELIGTEIAILIQPDLSRPNVYLNGFLDIVFKDKKGSKFYILDLKTSTRGWKDWDKKDQTKTDQLLLYKIYFSRQYNIPIDQIDVQFIILKRKIDEDSMYPQRRVQTFNPSQGSISYNKTLKSFEAFINQCFLPDGSYNTEREYLAISKEGWNCKFCEFKDREDLCPKSNRL